MNHRINYLGFLSLLALIAILGWQTENTVYTVSLALPIICAISGSYQMNFSALMFKRRLHLRLCQK